MATTTNPIAPIDVHMAPTTSIAAKTASSTKANVSPTRYQTSDDEYEDIEVGKCRLPRKPPRRKVVSRYIGHDEAFVMDDMVGVGAVVASPQEQQPQPSPSSKELNVDATTSMSDDNEITPPPLPPPPTPTATPSLSPLQSELLSSSSKVPSNGVDGMHVENVELSTIMGHVDVSFSFL